MIDKGARSVLLLVASLLVVGLPGVNLAHSGEEQHALIEEQAGRSFRMVGDRFLIFAELTSQTGRHPVSLIIASPEQPRGLALLPSVLSALALGDEETQVILVGPDGFISPPLERDWLRTYELTDEDRDFLNRYAAAFEDYPFAGTVSPAHLDTTGTGGYSLGE